MLALSLPSRYLTGALEDEAAALWHAMLGPARDGLAALAGLGIAAVEVGDVRGERAPETVALALRTVRDAGLRPHAHLWLPARFTPDDVPATLEAAVTALTVSSDGSSGAWSDDALACCAVHGHKRHEPDAFTATVRDLCALEPWLRERGASAALEVCRSRPEGPFGGTYAEVEAVAAAVGDALGTRLGVTWDLGHTTWNHLQGLDALWPAPGFLTRVRHVHVHDVGGSGRTHFPLDEGRAPLQGFVERLREVGYDGLWDLELYPERWGGTPAERRSRLEDSVARLAEALS